MPGISPIIAETEEAAWAKYEELNQLISDDEALKTVSAFLGIDLSDYPATGPLPELPDLAAQSNAMKSRIQLFIDSAREANLSIAQLGRKMHGARGHLEFIGTPAQPQIYWSFGLMNMLAMGLILCHLFFRTT